MRADGGLFISFEGLEGAGKSTQIELLAQKLNDLGHEVVLSREPGGSILGERLRKVLLDNELKGHCSPVEEALLLVAGRKAHLRDIIEPALAEGKIVLVDRFADASLAYQGFGRQLGARWIQDLHALCGINKEPDLTFFFSISLEHSFERMALRSSWQAKDRIEQEGPEFFKRVKEGYDYLDSLNLKRWRKIQAEESMTMIHQEVYHYCCEML